VTQLAGMPRHTGVTVIPGGFATLWLPNTLWQPDLLAELCSREAALPSLDQFATTSIYSEL
jgi:hypothetical protein